MGLHFPVFALALKDLVDRPEDEVDGFFLRGLVGLDVDFRSFGSLVRRRDAGEFGDLTPAGLGVKTLHVAGFADRQRGVDEDLDERVVREGGTGHITLVTLIAPLAADRAKARAALANHTFIEVFVDAPLAVCESRDVKGLYAKARRGEIAEFTGISSPYEAPEAPEVHIKTDQTSQEEAVDLVLGAIDKILQGKGDDWEV